MPAKPQTLYLIDGHALLYRAYHAIRPGTMMAADRKTPTNAVFGFANTLKSIRNRFKPDLLAAVFDPHGEVKRSTQYDEFAAKLGAAFSGYKSHRDAMPDDLRPQIELAIEFCTCYGTPWFQVEGYEADDVLGTLARKGEKAGLHVVIVSGDKDLLQLVNPAIQMYDPMKDITFDEATVLSLKGIKPTQVPDWLGLQGDSADNNPGVAGVGEQTATKLLQQFGTMEAALVHYRNQFAGQDESIRAFVSAHEVQSCKEKAERAAVKPPKGVKVVDAYLYVQQERARACRDLATLCTDLPVELDLHKMTCRPPEVPKLAPLLKRLDFKTFMRDLDQQGVAQFEAQSAILDNSAPAVTQPVTHYLVVDDDTKLAVFTKELAGQPRIAVDTETTSVNPRAAELVGVSISWQANHAFYLPLMGPLGGQTLSRDKVMTALKAILEDEHVGKIGHHIKYDLQVLRRFGIELRGIVFDTMVAGWLLDPGALRLNLEELAYKYLGLRKIETHTLLGKGKNQTTMDLVPVDDVGCYACMDADYTWQLAAKLAPMLHEAGLEKLMNEIEVPLIAVLAEMEWTGFRVDKELLSKMSKHLQAQLVTCEDEIYRLAGEKFNISSPRQLGVILFEKLGLTSKGKTATGQDTTSEDVLQALQKDHELPRKILEYRGLLKLKNTYVDALPAMISSRTGRIHASFHQTGAETGRLASSDPNLQNIPIRSEEGRLIRAAFKPGEDGWKIVGADYSQIELRILAHYSQDAALLDAFAQGIDIHSAVAARLNHVAEKDVTPAQRSQAKAVNFGIIYGQTAFGLSNALKIGRREAQEIIDTYFAQHPGVSQCINEIVAQAREQGFVTTVLGRRRFIPQLRASDRGAKMLGERLAVNTVFQGSAADLIKKAMIDIHRELVRAKWQARMICQIHDELLFECPPQEVAPLSKLVKEKMEGALVLRVPLVVEVGAGDDWLGAKA